MSCCFTSWVSFSFSSQTNSQIYRWFYKSVQSLLISASQFDFNETIVFIYDSYLLFQISDSVRFQGNYFDSQSFSPSNCAFYFRMSSTLPSRSLAFLALNDANSKSVFTQHRDVSNSLQRLFHNPISSCYCSQDIFKGEGLIAP